MDCPHRILGARIHDPLACRAAHIAEQVLSFAYCLLACCLVVYGCAGRNGARQSLACFAMAFLALLLAPFALDITILVGFMLMGVGAAATCIAPVEFAPPAANNMFANTPVMPPPTAPQLPRAPGGAV